MTRAQIEEGLRRLATLATDLRIGGRDSERHSYPVWAHTKLVARVSEEFLEDLPATPELEGILRQGLKMARQEAESPNPRIVSITTTGASYEE